jgi:hypothetical protein
MRTYEVNTQNEKYRIQADDVDLGENVFENIDMSQILVFYRHGMYAAIFREWKSVVDVTIENL